MDCVGIDVEDSIRTVVEVGSSTDKASGNKGKLSN
jgi:hypothetical protein